jgi:hypothetical protein
MIVKEAFLLLFNNGLKMRNQQFPVQWKTSRVEIYNPEKKAREKSKETRFCYKGKEIA